MVACLIEMLDPKYPFFLAPSFNSTCLKGSIGFLHLLMDQQKFDIIEVCMSRYIAQ